MSAGLTFIRACIDHGARTEFQSVPRHMYTEEEFRVLDFVEGFLRRYGHMPTYAIMLENQMATPAATGTVDYHLQRLSDRTIYRAYSERQTPLHQALMANNMDAVREMFREIGQLIQSVDVHRNVVEITEAMADAWLAYQVARDSPGLQGITYGWEELDALTGGIRPGDVGTIVARPGLGKTFTILKAAVAAWREGASVSLISMEMTAVENARRVLGMETGVSHDFLLRGRMSQWGEEIVESYLQNTANRPPFTIMTGDLSKSVSDVDAFIQEHSPDFVCIDASYLLHPSEKRYKGKRWEAMAAVGEEIKGLALRRNRPILQTVQFNRSSSPDEEMDLSQIGGTDVVGQVSSLVLGMRRGPAPYERSRRRYLVLKNRHGPDGTSFLTHFQFEPFNMDVVEDDPEATGEDGEWNGHIGEQPTNLDWTNA